MEHFCKLKNVFRTQQGARALSSLRERPFNLKGGGYVFFRKKYSDYDGGKKKSDSEFLSYNLMLNYGTKFSASRDKQQIF